MFLFAQLVSKKSHDLKYVSIYIYTLHLSVLLQVVVQNLRVGLLVWCQDMHEWSWSVAGSGRRVDGAPAAQRRGQAE